MPAVNTSIAVLFHSTGDDPDATDTVPLRPSARHLRANVKASAHPANNGTGMLRTAARGLLVTPWFAAASGIVIAASLWIYAPHAHIEFPSGSAIQSSHCNKGCASASGGKDTGQLAASGKGSLADSRNSGKRAGTSQPAHSVDRAAVKGLSFSYYPLRTNHGFELMIRVVSEHPIKAWELHFVLPGARIRQVWGARWHRTSPDSGTVRGSQAGQGNGIGQGDNGQFGGGTHQYGFTFVVSGSGQPFGPTDCVYNGQSCVFTNGRPGPS
jgi:hypothetical protein